MKPAIAVLRGRLAEGARPRQGRAGSNTGTPSNPPDRAAAAEAKLLEIALRQKRNEISQADALRELETLRRPGAATASRSGRSRCWRGSTPTPDATARRFAAARIGDQAAAQFGGFAAGQDAAAALFAQLFLSPKGDDLPPVDALGMFYEYRELTPIGRRGDEMIRRLADRLVAVDLLDQAAELLQYQVDKRLEGAARAQVAARLAMVYLTNRKPDRAISALRTTRIADLSGELRQQRLLLEARAQSDVGRHDLALDIISNITGREAIRLRSDIYWASRRWREASEQIELYYADRWRDFKPLNSGGEERRDPRRGRIRAGRGCPRAGAVPRKICAVDERRRRPDRVRDREQAGRRQQRRIRRDRQDGRQRRYARRLPARDEDALPGRHRAGAAAAGNRRRATRSTPARCRGSSD